MFVALDRSTPRLLCTVLTFSGVMLVCSCSTNLVPRDVSIDAGEAIEVRAGVGVKLGSVDGENVSSRKVVALAGKHTIDFKVRRSWRQVWEYLDGVESVGECSLVLDAIPGERYRIKTDLRREQKRVRPAAPSAMSSVFPT